LKTLEEPPPYVVFILATTEYQKVPATITSRCQRFDFRRVGPADIVGRLQYVAKSENLVLQDDAARLIARHAEGALRDALTLLEQVSAFSGDSITAADVRLVLGGVSEELIHGLIESIASGDARAVLTATEAAVAEGASFGQLARDLTSYARDLMLLTVGFPGDEGLEPEEAALRQHHAHALGRPRIEALLTSLREAAKEMRENVDHRLILELTLVRATDAGFGQPLPAALPRQAAAAPAGLADAARATRDAGSGANCTGNGCAGAAPSALRAIPNHHSRLRGCVRRRRSPARARRAAGHAPTGASRSRAISCRRGGLRGGSLGSTGRGSGRCRGSSRLTRHRPQKGPAHRDLRGFA